MQAASSSLLSRCKKIPPHGWVFGGFAFLVLCQLLLLSDQLQQDKLEQRSIERRKNIVEIQKNLAISLSDLAIYIQYESHQSTKENLIRQKQLEAKLEKDFNTLLEAAIKANESKAFNHVVLAFSWVKLRWLQLVEESERTPEEQQEFIQKLLEASHFLIMPSVDEEQSSSIYSIMVLQKLYRLGEMQLFLAWQGAQKEEFERENFFDLSLLREGIGSSRNEKTNGKTIGQYTISNYAITQYLRKHLSEIEGLLNRLLNAKIQQEAIELRNFDLAQQALEELNKAILSGKQNREEVIRQITYLWIFYLDRLEEILRVNYAIVSRSYRLYLSFYLLFCLLGVGLTCYGIYMGMKLNWQIKEFKKRLILNNQLPDTQEQTDGYYNALFFSKIAEDLYKMKRSCDDKKLLIQSSVKEMLHQANEQGEIASKQEKISRMLTLKCATVGDSNRTLFHFICETKTLIDKIFRLSDQGADFLIALENSMQQLIANTGLLQEILKKLSSQVQSIKILMNTMVSVTDQTHLLALNTSLESARVKEGGKGVEVIAKQIDRLADQTAQAALSVEYLIEKMCSLVQQNEKKVEDIICSTIQSVESSNQMKKHFSKICDKVKLLEEEFEELRLVSEEQSLHITAMQHSLQGLQTLPLSLLSQRDQLTALAEELAKNGSTSTNSGFLYSSS